VLNKADQLSADELAETVGFTESVCRAAGVDPGPIFAMSARNADDGFQTFRSQFDGYLSAHGQADTKRAIRGHLARLAAGMRDEALIELRAIELGRGQAAKTVAAFREHLAALSAEAVALDDRCRAAERRLRRELDEDAHEQTRQLTHRARAELSVAFDQVSGDLLAAEVEQRGRDLLERVVGEAVLAWRAGRAKELERRLAELIAGIEAERARQLDSLREHAREDLALTLTTGMEPLPLHPGRMFWLDFAPAPAVELPGSQLVRTHGPGAARRARRRVLDDVASITDRQVGRARSDLQHRLGETVRRTIAAVRVHHVETLDRLRGALTRATEMQQRTGAEVDAELARLQARVTALEEIVSAAQAA
jgi:hypothetical protein